MKFQTSTLLVAVGILLPACGDGSSDGAPPPPAPDAPTGLSAVRGDAQVLLSWDAVADATTYTVYGAAAPGVSPATWASLPSGFRIPDAVSPKLVAGLVNHTTYYFVVTASNQGSEGPPSAEVPATPIPPPPAPGSLAATPGNGRITLTWPSSPTATSYFVYSADIAGVTPSNWSSLPGGRRVPVAASPYERRGLDNGIARHFVVTGVNDVGEGPPSAPASATPDAGGGPEVVPLPFHVVDAEYDRAGERIVAVTSTPHRLRTIDPVTLAQTELALPLAPTCVSLRPDGLFAAVGHDAWVSIVDLTSNTLVQTWRVGHVAGDVVYAGNGYVHVFPTGNGVRSIRVDTGEETIVPAILVSNAVARLHPDGGRVYAGDRFIGPGDIFRFDVDAGPAEYVAESPYHGDPETGGPIWLSEDGSRIFTRPGSVFDEALLHAGDLAQTAYIQSLDQRDAGGRLALVPENRFADHEDTEVHVYAYPSLAFARKIPIPPITARGNTWATHGRFLFMHGDGDRCFVLVRAENKARLDQAPWGLARLRASVSGLPAPTGLVIVRSSSTSAKLEWDPVLGATGYRVYLSSMSGVLPGAGGQEVGAPFFNLPDMAPGETIYAVVTALVPGEIGPSPELEYVHVPGTSAGVPENVVATGGDGQVTLAWTPSAGAVGYRIYGNRRPGARADDDYPYPGAFQRDVAGPPAVVDGLQNGAVYFLSVTARPANGESIRSLEVRGIPTADPAPALQPLAYRVVDAGYSRALDRLVLAADDPASLRLYDPVGGTDAAIALPAAPTCVSVSLDGLSAVVGHDGLLTHVDLSSAAVLNTWVVPMTVLDAALGTGAAYVTATTSVPMHAVDLATGAATSVGRSSQRQLLGLHIGGSALYAGDVGQDGLDRYAVSGTTATWLYSMVQPSPLPGGVPIWMADDGASLLTQRGRRFSTTSVRATDMVYQGRLPGMTKVRAVDPDAARMRGAVIPWEFGSPTPWDTWVEVFEDRHLEPTKAVTLPSFDVGGALHAARGRFVFFSADGSRLHAVVQADPSSGLAQDYAVVTLDPD